LPSQVCDSKGNTLVHLVARENLEQAGLFLVRSGCDANQTNADGESPLHAAAAAGLVDLARHLLLAGSNANVQTFAGSDFNAFRRTPMHVALANGHREAVRVILKNSTVSLDLNLKDTDDQTPLSLALSNGMQDVAIDLITGTGILILSVAL
jgi:ankyrin repeat protein